MGQVALAVIMIRGQHSDHQTRSRHAPSASDHPGTGARLLSRNGEHHPEPSRDALIDSQDQRVRRTNTLGFTGNRRVSAVASGLIFRVTTREPIPTVDGSNTLATDDQQELGRR